MSEVKRECVTHHHACDCREAEFASLKAENERLKETLKHDIDKIEAQYLQQLTALRTAAEGMREALDAQEFKDERGMDLSYYEYTSLSYRTREEIAKALAAYKALGEGK